MKRSIMKIAALCMGVAVATGSIACTVYGLNKEEQKTVKTAEAKPTEESGREESEEKDETVYVLTAADGSVEKIIVSDWIKNALGSKVISDKTQLKNIETVKGEESFQTGSDSSCIWDAQGNDIYYQGNINKELPVDMKVTYTLDGTPISAKELAGKSGKVTIRFDYTNRQYEEVDLNGKKEKIYVPFAMVTGLLLDDQIFTNVEVTNGKLLNDGSRTAVVGVAFPGMQENLALSEDQIRIPDYVEISADAKKFALDMTVTLATNQIFRDVDTKDLDSVDDLKASAETLQGAMNQLMSGSSKLYEGISELLTKSGELTDGVDQLSAGAETLKNGTGDLDDGVAKLQSGADKLSEGLNTLTANNDALNGGAEQIFQTLLATADGQLKAAGLNVPALTIANYEEVLTGVISSLDENAVYEKALKTVTEAVEAKREFIQSQVTDAVRKEVEEQVTEAVREQVTAQVTQAVSASVEEQVIYGALQMNRESYEAAVKAGMIDEKTQAAIQEAVSGQLESKQVTDTIQAKTEEAMAAETALSAIAANTEEQMKSDSIKETVASNTEMQIKKAIADNMASEEVQAQLAQASEGAKAVITLKTSLDSYQTFYDGLRSYTAGVTQAASGAGELKAGTEELKSGADQLSAGSAKLYDGIGQLKAKIPALVDGVSQLQGGSGQLDGGLTKLNDQGIQKLTDAVNGDLKGLAERIRATKKVAEGYRTFAGASEEMDSQVKFIYRTDSIAY